jgi:hypothetical protein
MEGRGLLPRPYLLGPNHNIKRWYWPEVVKTIIGDEHDDAAPREKYFRGLGRGAA